MSLTNPTPHPLLPPSKGERVVEPEQRPPATLYDAVTERDTGWAIVQMAMKRVRLHVERLRSNPGTTSLRELGVLLDIAQHSAAFMAMGDSTDTSDLEALSKALLRLLLPEEKR